MKNIPAEIIDKIQVFDQQSEQAQFTGFDDGVSKETINIVTKLEYRNGIFGSVQAGYRTDDRYMADGNVNLFNGDRRISLLAQSNNVNRQGELTLSVFDLLNQNKNMSRTVTDSYIEDSQSEVLQHYLMLSFSYKIRNSKQRN